MDEFAHNPEGENELSGPRSWTFQELLLIVIGLQVAHGSFFRSKDKKNPLALASPQQEDLNFNSKAITLLRALLVQHPLFLGLQSL
jgi:hypothetical protein